MKKDIVNETSYILLSNKFTTLFFEIKDSLKKLKGKDNIKVTFGVKNKNFNAILTNEFFKKKELLNLIHILKKINKNHFICKKISFINPQLRFDFWIDSGKQFLDINFIFSNNTFDTYILALDEEDIKNLYNVLNMQISTNK